MGPNEKNMECTLDSDCPFGAVCCPGNVTVAYTCCPVTPSYRVFWVVSIILSVSLFLCGLGYVIRKLASRKRRNGRSPRPRHNSPVTRRRHVSVRVCTDQHRPLESQVSVSSTSSSRVLIQQEANHAVDGNNCGNPRVHIMSTSGNPDLFRESILADDPPMYDDQMLTTASSNAPPDYNSVVTYG